MLKKAIVTLMSLILSNFNLAYAQDFSHLDPKKEIPKHLLTKTLNYYRENIAKIKNKSVIGILDFKQHNSKERLYIIDMETGLVDRYLVAHGKNSDKDFDGFATEFSNVQDSLMSSVGFYLTEKTYFGKKGYSLRLLGLSETNSNAFDREIVFHGADYVTPSRDIIGRSWGCPAIEPKFTKDVIDRIKNGALLYFE